MTIKVSYWVKFKYSALCPCPLWPCLSSGLSLALTVGLASLFALRDLGPSHTASTLGWSLNSQAPWLLPASCMTTEQGWQEPCWVWAPGLCCEPSGCPAVPTLGLTPPHPLPCRLEALVLRLLPHSTSLPPCPSAPVYIFWVQLCILCHRDIGSPRWDLVISCPQRYKPAGTCSPGRWGLPSRPSAGMVLCPAALTLAPPFMPSSQPGLQAAFGACAGSPLNPAPPYRVLTGPPCPGSQTPFLHFLPCLAPTPPDSRVQVCTFLHPSELWTVHFSLNTPPIGFCALPVLLAFLWPLSSSAH